MSREIVDEGAGTGLEIAIVGMAGRFPGARNIAQFWDNLEKGVETISFFSDPELADAGIDPEIIKNPQYVKALGVLEDVEFFDAAFFEYVPDEALVMDPQIRILHESAYAALEDAGYDPDSYPGFIGLYVGAALGFNWQLLSLLTGAEGTVGSYAASLLKDKDFIATRVSYKLNLKGPSLSVVTACSTSLVTVNLACQGLLSGECDMALAGGAKVLFPQEGGNIYREGMIMSPDGHCRAFDAAAKGTISGSGVGVVVLKLLEQAIADKDHIYAVIKGMATNNDGFRKAGFAAPSIDGQAEVVQDALRMAAVEAESIGYVETHGTGTAMGDPVEMAALKLAFDTKKRGYCALGSVKTSVGHLDSTAGIAGFIKTALMLKHKSIPANLHYTTPNPQIDFENSPFYVNNELSEWKNDNYPLRAGVSSFGIGGTNAHVILEEWPGPTRVGERLDIHENQSPVPSSKVFAPLFSKSGPPEAEDYQLIILSAKSKTALDNMTVNLAEYFKKHPGIDLADAAYTLQVGRKAFKHRKMLCCSTTAEAVSLLAPADFEQVKSLAVRREERPVIFMFSGQGAQYVDMGRGIYESQPLFRQIMDECFGILKSTLDLDLKEIIYSSQGALLKNRPLDPRKTFDEAADINRTEITQPVLFIFEYALAKLLMSWGITPKAMIGHSIGEYTAACLSGVFSLADALKLVVYRGKLMQQMPPGSMLSIAIPEEELVPLLENKSVSLAAVNSSKQCVVSGSHKAVETFAKELAERGYNVRHLHTSHAFHSPMMEPVLPEFEARVKEVALNKPGIPYISNVSGNWIKTGEAVDPAYWPGQIRGTVRFADGLQKLFEEKDALLVEVGPGKALCTFVRQHNEKKTGHQAINLVRHPKEDAADHYYLLDRLGQCWLYGVKIDWTGYHGEETPYRVPLPAYPFDRLRYWLEGNPYKIGMKMMGSKTSLQKKSDMADWFYVPLWERISPETGPNGADETPNVWLVFIDRSEPVDTALMERLEQGQEDVIVVRSGSGFKRLSSGEYIIDPAASDDYRALFRELKIDDNVPTRIAHFWNVTGTGSRETDLKTIGQIQDTGLFSLLHIVQAIGSEGISSDIRIAVVSDGLQDVTGEEVLCPLKATLLGAVKVIPLEYPNIACKSVDIPAAAAASCDSPGNSSTGKFIETLLKELHSNYSYNMVALRGNYCWAPVMKPVRLEDVPQPNRRLKERGVYVITGGMGGMGFTLAGHLSRAVKARLILVGRSPFPPRQEWAGWLSTHAEEDKVSKKIQEIRKWEDAGAEVMIFSADISDSGQMQEMVSRAKEQFGAINGVLHTAGLADYEGVIQRRTRDKTEAVMAPKVKGTLALEQALKDSELDFLMLFSSIGNMLYRVKFGQVGYNAANEFLDAYACYKNRKDSVFTITVNWCDWLDVGMSVAAIKRRAPHEEENPDMASLLYGAVTQEEGIEIFNRLLAGNLVRAAVSTQDLDAVLTRLDSETDEEPVSPGAPAAEPASPSSSMIPRPDLSSEYAAPGSETEKKLVGIWQGFFGVDRVGIHDDFFELGGDSLQVMTLTSHIRKALNIAIPIQVFFAGSTIKKLAGYISSSSEEDGHVYTAIEPVEEKEFFSLSSAQKRVYILQQMDKSSTSYNQLRMEYLDVEPDRGRIREVFRMLILRHKILRTSFELIETEPVQKIHRPEDVEFEIEYYDIGVREKQVPVPVGDDISYMRPETESGLGARRAPEVKRIIADFVRPFDLSQLPLFRTGLVKIGAGQYILMVDLHHVISDGTSNAIFMKELISLYNGDELSPLKLRYHDFSEWQNSLGESGELKKQEEYWMKEFAGGTPVLNLPIDYERPKIRDFAGGEFRFVISIDELEKLREIARLADSTMFMLMLTIYNVFLSWLSGQEDITIGTISAGRGHPGLENIMGMFVNTLALRNYPAGEKTFIDLVKEVKQGTLEVFANQDYQFEELVDKLQAGRDTGRNPLFDTMFAYRAEQWSQVEETGKAQPGYLYDDVQAKFDLILAGIERRDYLVLIFVYAAGLFKRETVERFAGYFREIVTTVTKNSMIHVNDIAISHNLGKLKSDVYGNEASEFDF